MDVGHLLTDELDYEFSIRSLLPHQPNAIDRLRKLIELESQGQAETPIGSEVMTRNSVGKELQECERKLAEIRKAMENAERSADDSLIERARSRVIHVMDRIKRLQQRAPDHAGVDRLWVRVQGFFLDFESARDSLGFGEAAALVEGIGEKDPLTETDPQVFQQAITHGAVPKSRNSDLLMTFGNRQRTSASVAQQQSSNSRVVPLDSPQAVLNEARQFMPAGFQQMPANRALDVQLRRNSVHSDRRQTLPHPNYADVRCTDRVVSGAFASRFDDAAQYLDPQIQGFFDNVAGTAHQHRSVAPVFDQYPPSPRPAGPDPAICNSRRGSGGQHPSGNFTGGHNIHKWALRFDGHNDELDARDFIFRIERQAQLYGVAQQALAIGVGELLTGKAAQWYWTYQRQAPNATWECFKQAFLRRYSPNENTDLEIRSNIENRWQRPQESFNDFCQDIEALAVRLVRPMTEAELVEMLRRNMSTHLQKALWQTQARTVDELLRHCNAYEKMLRDAKRRDGQGS